MKQSGRRTTIAPEDRTPRMRSYYKYYEKNKKKQLVLKRTRKAVLLATFAVQACSRCGYDENPVALEFHHPDGREYDIHPGIFQGALDVAMAEVAKCVILCSNCHRITHAA